MIDNSGKSLEGDPIVLTKVNVDAIEVPRDDFKVLVTPTLGTYTIAPDCMRYVEANGKSYAVTYHNCPSEFNNYDVKRIEDYKPHVIYKCSECKLVTWIEVEV